MWRWQIPLLSFLTSSVWVMHRSDLVYKSVSFRLCRPCENLKAILACLANDVKQDHEPKPPPPPLAGIGLTHSKCEKITELQWQQIKRHKKKLLKNNQFNALGGDKPSGKLQGGRCINSMTLIHFAAQRQSEAKRRVGIGAWLWVRQQQTCKLLKMWTRWFKVFHFHTKPFLSA